MLALIVIALSLNIVFRVYEFVKPQPSPVLEEIAYATLSSLDSEGYLAKAIYGEDLRLLETTLNSVVPTGYGYNCTVYGESWSRLLDVKSRGYDPTGQAAQSTSCGCNDTLLVRYVVLSVSGG